jgi:hypothetical protein
MRLYMLLLVSAPLCALCAQTDEDFEGFRKKLYSSYNDFRKNVLDDYAKYLDNAWKEYQTLAGEVRVVNPKPVTPDVYKPVGDAPVDIPIESPLPKDDVSAKPVVQPVTSPIPNLPSTRPVMRQVNVNFYGVPVSLPDVGIMQNISDCKENCSALWKQLKKCDTATLIQSVRSTASSLGLNDWFTFQLVRRYADTVAASARNIDRVAIQHYILCNMGYDVRIAKTSRQYVLLVPFRQQVYVVCYLRINNKNYYVYCDEKDDIYEKSPSLTTCDIPADVDCGRQLNLQISNAMNIDSGNVRSKTISDGKISVTCSFDVLTMEMLRHYPQTDIPVYAVSDVMPVLRDDVLSQIEPTIKDMSLKAAANKLLHFVQYSFKYATDDEQHGYEKPYFFEENFYYDKNDCEDRAVFFAYLVRRLLNLDVHLIHYPEHECTAVCFPDDSVSGDGYMYEGKRFVICDPTFIGALIGNCMPRYKSTTPKVELW